MEIVFHPANKRGHANHGWLDAHHSFSFAGWFDPKKVHFGMLRVLNDDIIDGGMGFGRHPHDNMEIITVMLSGVLEHKDSMGHTQTIEPGEVQVMSAGAGITHSEYNHLRDAKANLLQLWIFPSVRNVEPRYDQKRFDPEARVNTLQNLVAPISDTGDALKIHQDAWIYRTSLDAGAEVTHRLHGPASGLYVFMIDGEAEAAGQHLGRKDAAGISQTGEVAIKAVKKSDILLIEVPMAG